jgi:hypothetical protein
LSASVERTQSLFFIAADPRCGAATAPQRDRAFGDLGQALEAWRSRSAKVSIMDFDRDCQYVIDGLFSPFPPKVEGTAREFYAGFISAPVY